MENLRSIYEAFGSRQIQGFGIKNGLMGYAILTYSLFQETKNEEYMKSADSMIDRIVEKLEDSSSLTFLEFSEIGWGLSYLIRKEFLLDDGTALEKLDSLFRNILLNKELDIETTVNIGLYFCSCSISDDLLWNRAKRNLLLCQQILVDAYADTKLLESHQLLNYLSLLTGLFHLNIFRFRTMNLCFNALSVLQATERKLNDSELMCYAFIMNPLMEDKYIGSFIQKQSSSLYEFALRFIQRYSSVSDSFFKHPTIYEMDGKIYLIPDNSYCILLASVNH